MKSRPIAWLSLALCLCLTPVAALGEDFLVVDGAQPAAAATAAPGDAAAQAKAMLAAGSYLDAFNAFSALRGEPDAPKYAAYAKARLLLLRDDPAGAEALLAPLGGFLDSAYQLALAQALHAHRYRQGDAFGYVDAQGAWRVAPPFDWAERVFRATSATTQSAGETPYAVAAVFAGETAVQDGDLVPVSGMYGLVRSDGLLLAPAAYEAVLWAKDGYAALRAADGCTLLDIAAGQALPGLYEDVGEYAQGLIPVCQGGLWGYWDVARGALLGEGCVWETARAFSEGLAAVAQGKLYGYVDTAGQLRIPLQYSDAAAFSEGLAGVCVKKRWGFIDIAGATVLAPAYAAVQTFQGGLCAVQRGSAWGLIDRTGEMVLRAKYSEIGDFDPIYHRAWIRQNKLWGLVSSAGVVVLKPAWGQHDEFGGNTLCRVAYRGAYGYVDAGGKTRIPNLYAAAAPYTAGYAAVQKKGQAVAYVDKNQRGFTLETAVPVECRMGFIEGRAVTETQTTATDEAGQPVVTVATQIAFALYNGEGQPIAVQPYTQAGAQP